jgi:hypothetical protein
VLTQQQLVFVKTLDGESFRTDLEPSNFNIPKTSRISLLAISLFNLDLSVNVSYIQAIDFQGNQITYSLNSTNFYADKYTGQVFLISRLAPDAYNTPNNFKTVAISASNNLNTITQINAVSIINANNRPAEFVTSQRVFEIEEVCL